VIAQLAAHCEAQAANPLLQYLEEFALQSRHCTLTAAQLAFFHRVNHFALQVQQVSAAWC
jgi:hypothetical protein